MKDFLLIPYDEHKPCEIVTFSGDSFLDFAYEKIGCDMIEVVPVYSPICDFFKADFDIILDEEGKLKRDYPFKVNPRATFLYCGNQFHDFIVGNVLIALDLHDEEFSGLNPDHMHNILRFLEYNGFTL